ncbi:MAG: YjfB family protein [Oscillospiraceae bacterium]|nr:YjfB family protein [Oscillospiraceae bacterium]MDY3791557.1 YjfB family protein [Oscillospiraceae bacterium]MDY6209190.1 YjfB family protein [Oscillospiraceae bacterium]
MDPTAIASMATSMKQAQLANAVSTAMVKKTHDVMETQAQGIIEMAQSMPKVQGQIGSILDVRA